jgi:hypothetical protein
MGRELTTEQASAMAKAGGGRPRGAISKPKRIMKELAEAIICNLKVQNNLIAQAEKGLLHPRLMVELFHYYGGRPVHKVQVEQVVDAEAQDRRRQLQMMPKAERLQLAELIMRANRVALPAVERAKPVKVIRAKAELVK